VTQILAATPAYGGHLTIPYHRSFVAMTVDCGKRGISIATMITHSGFVSRARNSAAATVIARPEFTHLLTIDADMGWPTTLLPRLLEADKDIVGATYPRRALTDRPQFIAGIEEGAEVVDGFAKALYVGCGFMLVKRETLVTLAMAYPARQHADDTLKIPVFDLFPSGAMGGVCVTDDVGFCRLARSAGFEVWADLTTSLSHTGPVTFEVGPMTDYLEGLT
jgi:hypothetical protein